MRKGLSYTRQVYTDVEFMPRCSHPNPGEALDFRHFLLVSKDTWNIIIGKKNVSREKTITKLPHRQARYRQMEVLCHPNIHGHRLL